MTQFHLKIRPTSKKDISWIKKVSLEEWGGEFCIFLSKKFYIDKLPGFIAEDKLKSKIGLITFEIRDDLIEIMTLNAFIKFKGIGSLLLKKVVDEGIKLNIKKIIVKTTNDNLDAFRFYQKRGFVITKIHLNSLKKDRKIKPSIPKLGDFDIPIRDAIELQRKI